jgi:hypothetical protein
MSRPVEQYVDLLLKDLYGGSLTEEERAFLEGMEAAAALLPGVLEEQLLAQGLTPVPDPKPVSPWATPGHAFVLAESRPSDVLFREVQGALARGERVYVIFHGSERLEVLDLLTEQGMVAPRSVQDHTFYVERKGQAPQLVGGLGGIYIDVEDLKGMVLEHDPIGHAVRLREI